MERTTGQLRARIRRGDQLLGTFSVLPVPEVIELIGIGGFDAVVFDMEHGPYTPANLQNCLLAAERHGLATLVRVPDSSTGTIGSLLDLGVEGIVVPHLESAQAAASVVASCRFAPAGNRSAHPWVRAARYSAPSDYYAAQDDRVAVIGMIEGVRGTAAAKDIAHTSGLDAIFIGPVDLSHSLGVPDDVTHPAVIKQVTHLVTIARQAGVTAAIFCDSPEHARLWRQLGINFIVYGVDAHLIVAGLAAALSSAEFRPSMNDAPD